MKTYYQSGKLRQTFWYVNGLREDTAIWYHEDGAIFRKTPFKRDSMNGVQIQYYKSGKIRAKLDYVDGLRKPYLEEFKEDGKKITDYPQVIVKTKDNYNQDGTYKIDLSLSKPGVKVTFYRGDLVDGLFDPKKVKKISNTETTGSLLLSKSSSQGPGYVGIISEISTTMGNKLLVYNKVTLPYADLK
jgi:antitoxin component YwqK of YwqJK toxin-antitoxin module